MPFPSKTTGQAAEAHPSVVLRSRFIRLRALLAVATVVLVGVAASVMLTTHDEVDRRGTVPAPPPSTPHHGDPGILGPPQSTPYHGDPGILGPRPSTPYYGDPGILGPRPSTRDDGDRGRFRARPPRASSASAMKDEGVTAAAIGQASGGAEFRGSEASAIGTSAGQSPGGQTPR
jgi:hypothetical protein